MLDWPLSRRSTNTQISLRQIASQRAKYPMGEDKKREVAVRQQMVEALGLQTAGGPIKVRWDANRQATTQGQMAFFIEFFVATGLFDQWVKDCPLNYKSFNGSEPRDILGTWMLSILSGHWRYAHVSAVRADGVNPGLLGMSGVVAEDTLSGTESHRRDSWSSVAFAPHRAHRVGTVRGAVDIGCRCDGQMDHGISVVRVCCDGIAWRNNQMAVRC